MGATAPPGGDRAGNTEAGTPTDRPRRTAAEPTASGGAGPGRSERTEAVGERVPTGRPTGRGGRSSAASESPPPPEPLRVPVADSHTHMDTLRSGATDPAGTDRVADALALAASVGVTPVVQVGCDLAGARWAADVAERYDGVWATVALHPNEAPRIVLGDPADDSRPECRPPGGPAALDAALAEIDQLAGLPQVRGVGETGLDYFRTGAEGVEIQRQSFRRHIDIAKRHDKALVIHDREAHQDVLRLLAEEGAPRTVVFHCYSGDTRMARVCAERGYYMSFAGNVTFKNAQPLRDALAVVPTDLVLVETDAPFLTPVPHRGRPNASYLIPLTLRAMAEVRGVGEDELATAVAANTARVFGY